MISPGSVTDKIAEAKADLLILMQEQGDGSEEWADLMYRAWELLHEASAVVERATWYA